MVINNNDGIIDISLNTRYYDISHPFGAIRPFVVTTEPTECDGVVSWTAISDDCYREEILVRLSRDADNKDFIFKDHESANKFLVNEDIRIEFSSIEYQLMSAIDVLCNDAETNKAETFKSLIDSIELHLLILVIKLEPYDGMILDQVKEISNGFKEISKNTAGLKSAQQSDVYSTTLSFINCLKNYRDMVASIRETFAKLT